ncbi:MULTISPECIES: ThiF family adenylyltransferase [unclassified Bacillus cereus group]|uniref:ThiF family adenylyltransferase n=1 Tax=unclassified Bacillus cereus group TaxID=2750818 RepID=UPI001F55AF4F|nr:MULTISPECIES: ThiF family adenylyltransferase [unclassified Bacillus cereus group]
MITKVPHVIKLDGVYNDETYWERVNRSQAWLGETEEEQREAQIRLSNATVGVAGCGGIGGACAMRLARLGIRHIKVADPDSFDWTNVNRQYGAEKENLGKNKAEIVGHAVHRLVGDVTVEIYPEGITKDNAEHFVNGCDIVLDQMDFYLLGERYALHKAFRNSKKTKYILSAWCIGWGTSLYKWTHDGMSLEEFFNIPEDTELKGDIIKTLLSKFMPKEPLFPSTDEIYRWFVDKKIVPLFATSPPVAEAAVIPQVALAITGYDKKEGVTPIPAAPDCWVFDATTMKSEFLKYTGGKYVSQ